jgi:hypothetical protein
MGGRKMSKAHKYKEYEFWKTDITTDKTYKATNSDFYKTKKVNVYQVSGFNPRQRPFLTTIEECKNFIDEIEP